MRTFRPIGGVRAEKIKDIVKKDLGGFLMLADGRLQRVDMRFMRTHRPEPGQYYVQTKQFDSVYPAEVFESMYEEVVDGSPEGS